MTSKAALILFLIVMFMCQSCRMAEVLTGGEKAGTVDTLWHDVPALDGAMKSDIAIPLAARLFIRTAMKGKVNFISYTTTRSAREVKEFYNSRTMTAAGWKEGDAGCVGDSEGDDSTGVVCTYTRTNGSKEDGLAIIVAEDTKNRETHIFYARIDITPDENNNRPAAGS